MSINNRYTSLWLLNYLMYDDIRKHLVVDGTNLKKSQSISIKIFTLRTLTVPANITYYETRRMFLQHNNNIINVFAYPTLGV